MNFTKTTTPAGKTKERLVFHVYKARATVARYDMDNSQVHVILDLTNGETTSELMSLAQVEGYIKNVLGDCPSLEVFQNEKRTV